MKNSIVSNSNPRKMYLPVKGFLPKLSNRQGSILLTLIALLLWSYSILTAEFRIGEFGLIHGLPVTFFIALAMLTSASSVLWVSRKKHNRLLCLQLIVMIGMLWLSPLLISGSTPFVADSYRYFGWTDYIVRMGHFDSGELWYHSFPGSFILYSVVVEIVNPRNLSTMLNIFPLFMQLFCLPLIFVFLRNLISSQHSNYCWAGCWLFYLANWTGRDVLNAQCYSFVLLLALIIMITTAKLWERGLKLSVSWVAVMLIIVAAITVAHLLTILVVSLIIAAFFLIKRSRNMLLIGTLSAVVIISWIAIGAHGFINQRLLIAESEITNAGDEVRVPDNAVITPIITTAPGDKIRVPVTEITTPTEDNHSLIALRPLHVINKNITERIAGSESHVSVTKVRLLFSAIFFSITCFGIILYAKNRKEINIVIMVLAIAIVPFAILVFPDYISYQGELALRLYWFALPAMAFFGIKLFEKKSLAIALCVLLLFIPPLHYVARYGNSTIDYFSKAETAGLFFFHENTTGGYTMGRTPIGMMTNSEKYKRIPIDSMNMKGDIPKKQETEKYSNYYISIGRLEMEYFSFYKGVPFQIEQTEALLANSLCCKEVYTNSDMLLYSYSLTCVSN